MTLRLRPAAEHEPAPVVPHSELKIRELVPSPRGDETQEERVTVMNCGNVPIYLHRWALRDLTGRTWSLDGYGVLPPGLAILVMRAGQQMALNNSGDTIELIDPAGHIAHTVKYGNVRKDQVIKVAP